MTHLKDFLDTDSLLRHNEKLSSSTSFRIEIWAEANG